MANLQNVKHMISASSKLSADQKRRLLDELRDWEHHRKPTARQSKWFENVFSIILDAKKAPRLAEAGKPLAETVNM